MVGKKRPVPSKPKIYHIVHFDRLPSIIADGCLWSDAEVKRRKSPGTTIGIPGLKEARLTNTLRNCHPDLRVGECVPFYFCPRSVMLYVDYMGNHPKLEYRGGQGPIVHLETDLHEAVDWANANHRRWAFTLSNAASSYFEDRCDLAALDEIDWNAVEATDWRECREKKAAKFLVERSLTWERISFIGVHSLAIRDTVRQIVAAAVGHQPVVEVVPAWYY